MKKIKIVLDELVLPLLLSWFLMTILVDIIVIPTVFRNISSIQEAGKIGMTVFGRFNWIEVVMSSLILIGVTTRAHRSRWAIALAAFLFCHVLNYALVMTPTIAEATRLIHQTNSADPMFAVLQTKHAFYHTLYRYLDTTKLLLLLGFIVGRLIEAVKVNPGEQS